MNQKMRKFITYRVIFIPSKSLAKRAVKLASELSKRGSVHFRIDDKESYSHLTVYKAEFPKRNETKIFRLLRNFVIKQKPFKLTFKNFFNEWGWVGLDFKKNRDVYSAHKNIVRLLNPSRDGHIRQKYLEEIKTTDKYPGRQREYIMQYGYSQVMTEYHPHLTLVRFIDEKMSRLICEEFNQKNIKIADSLVKEIALVKSGEHGSVAKFVQRFKLGG
jgi:2'-5' RNA ligase